MMDRNNIVRVISLVMASLLAGCASYTPTLVRLDRTGPNVSKASNAGLTFTVDEYATPQKSQKAFDTDLANEGVLPLLLVVENSAKESYEVQPSEIVVKGKSSLKGLAPEEAASRAQWNAVGPAVGWSLIVPIVAIPVAAVASAVHTSNVNEKIRHDFAAKAFTKEVILPNKGHSGFLFFEMEEGRKDLSGLTLEMTARNVVTGTTVTITAPLPAATFTRKEEISSEEEECGYQTYTRPGCGP